MTLKDVDLSAGIGDRGQKHSEATSCTPIFKYFVLRWVVLVGMEELFLHIRAMERAAFL